MARLAAFDTVVLVHGKDGSPSTGWCPWVKRQLEAQGFRCIVPTFPPEDDSKLKDWFVVFGGQNIDFVRTAFVAHARGAMALMRWINTLPPAVRIPKVVTISANFDYQPQRTDGDKFYNSPLNFADLRQKCTDFVVIHSEDDPYVAIEAGEHLSQSVGAKFVRYKNAGHFGADKHEAPEIIKELIG